MEMEYHVYGEGLEAIERAIYGMVRSKNTTNTHWFKVLRCFEQFHRDLGILELGLLLEFGFLCFRGCVCVCGNRD